MKIFLFKQELHFCQGDGYFWPHCCMNNLYISHRSLYAPTYSFWAIRSMLISRCASGAVKRDFRTYKHIHKRIYIKGINLSKALTCMKIFLYKQELQFCQGDRYFWPHCCMNNLYISHRSLYAPKYSFWAIGSMLISLFRVTSWFDTVNNAVTRWMIFRENHLHEHDLQLFDYNI